ncbi:MAG: hypothetical protein EPO07_14025 [Verrucomicrobia bacterium]|nr:MAG: hypothetical protein EPO07_14025 [Verrucomicrobiota bacterium]
MPAWIERGFILRRFVGLNEGDHYMKIISKLGLLLLLAGQTVVVQAATTVTNIAAGVEHNLMLLSDGSLWGMGRTGEGELGKATGAFTNRPIQIISSNVTAIECANDFSLFLKSDTSLWTMGYNDSGQLGDGTYNNSVTNGPKQIVSSGVIAIAGGASHSLFLKSDGSLWGMGNNYDGQLGISMSYYNTNQPQQLVTSGVVAAAAGTYHSMFLKNDGSLWGMGGNYDGQLGDGTFNSTNRPEQIVASGVATIVCASGRSFFLKNNGSLWAMGFNNNGQLGDGTYTHTNQPEQIVASGVVAVAAGESHTLFIKSDGSLWGMGYSSELGGAVSGGLTRTNRPVKILSSNVVAVACGSTHSAFVKSDGSLWTMGHNDHGQLGDGFYYTQDSLVPEQILPIPLPVLTQSILQKTNLQLRATCKFGGVFHLIATTNITLPVSQWAMLRTNVINALANNNFSATITNPFASGIPQQFYLLQTQ